MAIEIECKGTTFRKVDFGYYATLCAIVGHFRALCAISGLSEVEFYQVNLS